ncbi:MAG: hypothetical protein HJJLKODD_00302 [Phycisphaerae bacterium]|nr:hypothetical protein [Phycisphaerae bacterium]
MPYTQFFMVLLAASRGDTFLWSALVILLLAGFWAVWWFLRRWFFSGAGGEIEQPFTLQQLRDLKERGELTAVEYETLRQQIIAEYKDTSGRDSRVP